MSDLRLMCLERYTINPSTACGYGIDEWEYLQGHELRCLADNDSDLESAEIWLIEASDEKGDTLDEVLLWSGERE